MIPFARGVRTVVGLELAQRVRGAAFYVLLGLCAALVAAVTVLLWVVGAESSNGGFLFSTIVYFVLLVCTLVTPALSGGAVNGDREAGTLATTQVTLVSTTQIVLGKFFASWITSIAFLVVSTPFLLSSFALGDVPVRTVLASMLVLLAELAVLSAVGVGLSAVIARPLFSVAATYLVVAALSIGTIIAFGLAGAAVQTDVRSTTVSIDYAEWSEDGQSEATCLPPQVSTYPVPRFDLFWGVLAANPYVVLADAGSGEFDADGNPRDLFSQFAVIVRGAQIPPDTDVEWNECEEAASGASDYPTPEETWSSTTPSWFVGLGAHVLLAGALLAWGIARTRTPATRLPAGQRIA